MDYYPGGYWVLVKDDSSGRKKLTSFEIKDPAIKSSESYSSSSICDSNGQPIGCVTILYVFEWNNEAWRKIQSKIPAHIFAWQSWYVDVFDIILDNARYYNNPEWDDVFPEWTTKELVVKQWNDELLVVKTYFWDDEDFNWLSFQKDISRKFVFRTPQDETIYIWIAHSDKTLWWSDDKVQPGDMWKLHFATIHVQANTHGELTYNAWVWPGDDTVKLLTVDMDNIAYDSTSTPELVPYIDVNVIRTDSNGDQKQVNKNGDYEDIPVHRISLQPEEYTKNFKTVPGIDTSKTDHSIWPSGSFLCNQGTIWTPGFENCYNSQSPEFKWITQHTINIPSHTNYQIVQFKLHNASTAFWNAFAVAWDIDMFWPDVPLEPLLDTLWWEVTGITSVEVDDTTADGENGYDDDTKETKNGYLHTYKTEVCNNSDSIVNNVFVKPVLPEKTTLVGDGSANIEDSSLLFNGSLLDIPIDEDKKLHISTFGSNINMWILHKWECKFITYQAIVNSTVVQWDNLKVKNEFSYDGWTTQYTNEVTNPVVAMPYDAEIVLDAEPTPWFDIYLKDYITYKFKVDNTGLSDIPSGSVSCGRYSDTTETECSVWDCWSNYAFTDFESGTELAVEYSVQVKDWQDPGTRIEEQCILSYDTWTGETDTKNSNIVFHTIIDQSNTVSGGDFSLELYSRPKLLNSPDGEPRPDGYDQSPIKYTYKYTGSNQDNMYPDLSDEWTYTDSRWKCDDLEWPNVPNSLTYNISSTSTSARSNINLSSNAISFSLNTTLPSSQPRTILSQWSLYPGHAVSSSEANTWYKNGGTKVVPLSSTEHRALENGTDGRIESTISGTTYLDTWKYIPYDTDKCQYEKECTNDGWCDSDSLIRYRTYTLYRWEMINRETLQFDAQAYRFVTVWGSSAWIKTSNGHVHTNNGLTEEGTTANRYDLWESDVSNVVSAPKLYAPVGSFHGDYVVSSNTSTTNLKSKTGWYLYNKQIIKGHGYVYDRLTNARDFYTDLIDKQKFWTVETMTDTTVSRIDMELNHIYYYPNNLTIEKSWGDVIVAWEKWTLVVWGDLYINSNMKYSIEEKGSIKELPYIWIIVKGSIYIDWEVTDSVWSWHWDGTYHTGESVKALRHLWNWTGTAFDFQRKAPEFYERDVNEPSEWIYFDDRIYFTTPPGFAELDDGVWSYKNNINQFTGEEVEW